MRAGAPLLAACAFAFTGSALAATQAVDMRGNLVGVEAITAVRESGGATSAIRVRITAPDGKVAEEIIPDTLDDEADALPVLLLDAASGDPVVLWSRHDGRRLEIAASRRASGVWTPTQILDSGKGEPAEFKADLGADSVLQVVWKSVSSAGEMLRHRAFDLQTLQPLGPASDPFAASKAIRSRRPGRTRAEGGSDDPGYIPNSTVPKGVTIVGGGDRTPAILDYGVAAACGATVVYRVQGSELGVATLAHGKWSRGTVKVGAEASKIDARALASDISRRFCAD